MEMYEHIARRIITPCLSMSHARHDYGSMSHARHDYGSMSHARYESWCDENRFISSSMFSGCVYSIRI